MLRSQKLIMMTATVSVNNAQNEHQQRLQATAAADVTGTIRQSSEQHIKF
jgi:hypothetical protein